MEKYEIDILNNEFTKNDLLKKIKSCSSYKDIISLLNRNLFTINSLNPPFGSLGAEHIQKCFEVAQYFLMSIFIPDLLGLREKFKELFNAEESNNTITESDKIQFFNKKFADLSFTDNELKNIINKLTINDYCSLDILTERAIMQLNAIDGIKSYNSCSGHTYALRYYSASSLSFSVKTSKINKEKLWEIIHTHLKELNNNFARIDLNENGNNIDINFFHIPDATWIKKHQKKTIKELCNKNLKILTEIFAYKSDFDTSSNSFDAITVDEIRKLIWKYVNSLNIYFDISDEEDAYFWKIFKPRCLSVEIEYMDYYKSKSAILNVKKFWNTLEQIAKDYKNSGEK